MNRNMPKSCSSIYVTYIKLYLHKNSQTVKKGAAHTKKRQHEKSCEIKGGGPEVDVV